MKFSIESSEVNKLLSVVSKTVDTSSVLPILESVLVKINKANNEIVFCTTNLESSIKAKTKEVRIEEEGNFVIPVKLFNSYLSSGVDSKLNFELDNNKLIIKSSKSKTEFQTHNPDDFPKINLEKGNVLKVSKKDLINGIKLTRFCASNDSSQQVFNSVLLNLNLEELDIVATDAHRLSEFKVKTNGESPKELSEQKILIPSRAIDVMSFVVSRAEVQGDEIDL